MRTVFGQSDDHHGVDIAVAAGTVIVSTSGGNVRDVTTIVDQQQVCISSQIGVECFIHLDDVVVAEGDRVVAGQKIGVIAATSASARKAELSTGDHLDYRVSVNGGWVDPVPYLEDLQ